ncbi:putative inorganic phosphate cotransporter [Parasteatoda tepidariorum]|uniref:putative inorganic phosphate cotransporter n=1 Tax=Parasteatoda tepidariorum TaxID=114398 RepID=UPI0039BC2872
MNTIIGSICNLLSPVAARTSPYLLFVAHLSKGLAQGISRAAIALLSARWFPICEKGYLSAFVLSGFSIGGVIGSAVSGPVCELDFDGGWPLAFYIFGLFGIFVSILIILFYVEKPVDDPSISQKELKYILENTNNITAADHPPIPWTAMLTSVPTYALIIAMFGQYWMMNYLLIHPFFMDTILNIPVKENGLLTSGPQFAQAIAGLTACCFSFWINRNDTSKIYLARKGCNSLAVAMFLVGLVGIYFSNCDLLWNIVFLYFISAAPAFTFGGSVIAAVDMTPTYCGPLMGLSTTVASLPGFMIPILTGKLTKYEQTMSQWHKLFLITSIVVSLNGVVFLIWGSTEIQPYDPAYRTEKRPESKPDVIVLEHSSTYF